MENKKSYFGLLLFVIVSALAFLIYQPIKNKEVLSKSEQSLSQHTLGMLENSLSALQKQIVKSFAEGDGNKLASYFDEEISLIILEDTDFYSKEESKEKLALFFEAHPPKNFTLKHHGSNKDQSSFYLIGEMQTTLKEKFQIYVANDEEKIKMIEITHPIGLSVN